ncbi:MAG: ABC transporter ATP-binding protein, partial [Sporomusa sp.]
LVLICAVLFVKKVTPLFEKLQILMDKINRTVRENIIGVRVIRAYNRTGQEKAKADESFNDYAETSIRVTKLFAAMLPMVMAVMNLCTLLIIWFGGKQVAAGGMQIGDIMAIMEYAILILMYLIMGVAVFAMVPRARTCLARINAVLDLDPESSNAPANSGDFEQSAIVEFNSVTFRYNNAEEAVLQNISLTARKGQTTAIIGGTGSGKSTIASLLIRLYDIQEGSVLINGKDIREYPQPELRDMIGYVPQKAFLFSGTIADNLRHGKKNATTEEMLHAAKIAQLDDFILGSEKGLDSHVSQGGSNLSGGQKQRLSIARAIIKNPDIFIFDDSFSALDFKTDMKLRAALKSEISSSAMIIVAQRISTITDADQIIVLDEGRIVGQGTHRELLRNCQVYQQIARSQLSEEELA